MIAVVLAAQAGYANGLLERDEQRLQQLKDRYTEQIDAAAQSYLATVERANTVLKRNYERIIEQYERRDDTATAKALAAELEQVLSKSREPIVPPAPAEPGHVQMIEAIGPALVNSRGQAVRSETLADKDYVLLYFSASWCGPCRAFTPSLVEFYQQYARGGDFEVVLVSSDRSAGDMAGYMRNMNMPFLAVPFQRIKASRLKNDYGGKGIPNLVIVNRDGEVVSGSYEDGQYVGPRKVLADMRSLLQ